MFRLASKIQSQKGFSLVELMVVVAIIGILAAIAIPSVNKYMAKARQSEAKTNLSSMYTSQKAFFAEYNTYSGTFSIIGFAPEGKLRYNVGFATNNVTAANLTASGYTATPTDASIAASAYCGANGAINANGCAMLNGADGAAPPAIAAGTCNQGTFTAEAAAVLQAGLTDRWTIDQVKSLNNTSLGIR